MQIRKGKTTSQKTNNAKQSLGVIYPKEELSQV